MAPMINLGEPLIIGTIISDGWLAQLQPHEICAWLCLFLQERRAIEVDGFELPVMSEALHAAVEHTDKLGELFEQVRKAACACTFTCTMHMTCQACWMHVQCVSEHMSIICIRP